MDEGELAIYAGIYLGLALYGLSARLADERWRELVWRAWWPF